MNVKNQHELILVLLRMEWNMKITIKVLFNATDMNHIINRIQKKIYDIETYRVNKVSLLCYNDKNMYLMMDTIGYSIFINQKCQCGAYNFVLIYIWLQLLKLIIKLK